MEKKRWKLMQGSLSIAPFILLAASHAAILASGILWTYLASGYLNVALGALFVAGGLGFAILQKEGGIAPWLAACMVTAVVGLISLGLEFTVFRRLRQRGAGSVALLLGSFAVYMVLENLLALETGNATLAPITPGNWGITWLAGFGLTPLEQGYCLVALTLMILGEAVLMFSSGGLALRAISENSELAALSMIPEKRVVAAAALTSGMCMAVAGIFVSLDVGLSATAGMPAAITGAVAAILGGLRRVSGIVLGAVAVATLQQTTVYLIGPQWENLVTYGVLVVALYFSRHRLFGGGIYPW